MKTETVETPTVEKKETQSISLEKFELALESELSRLVLGYIMSDPSKTADRMANMEKTRNQLKSKARENLIALGYKVKGTRSGHMNNAPPEIQEVCSDCNDKVKDFIWDSVDKNGKKCRAGAKVYAYVITD